MRRAAGAPEVGGHGHDERDGKGDAGEEVGCVRAGRRESLSVVVTHCLACEGEARRASAVGPEDEAILLVEERRRVAKQPPLEVAHVNETSKARGEESLRRESTLQAGAGSATANCLPISLWPAHSALGTWDARGCRARSSRCSSLCLRGWRSGGLEAWTLCSSRPAQGCGRWRAAVMGCAIYLAFFSLQARSGQGWFEHKASLQIISPPGSSRALLSS